MAQDRLRKVIPASAELEQKIIDAIYRGACEPAELERAMELIAELFDSSGALLGELDQAEPDAQLALGVRSIDQPFFADYAPYAKLDPAPRAFAALTVGNVTTTDRMFSQELLRTNIFLNEFLRPHGVEASLGGPLLSGAGRFAIIAIHQGRSRSGFDNEDIARLERLTPHLTRALQIRRLFLQSELRGQALETIVNRNAAGMIGLSGEGPALFVNDAARTVAGARDGISLDRDGRLVVADRTAAKCLATLEADVARGGAGGVVRIRRPSGGSPYVVLVSPLWTTNEAAFPRARSSVLFVIHDPSRRITSAVQRIAHLLNVPLGAAKIVDAILQGIELKEYADREAISINTVKFHLKTAFDRTGTRSQADLVRRALLSLTDLGPYFADR
jgi:PAS domain-containing protein